MKISAADWLKLQEALVELRDGAKSGSLVNPGVRAQNRALKLCDRLESICNTILEAQHDNQ